MSIPDYLRPDLDLVFVGINPGTTSAAAGHHYAGPGNHFWPLLYESGLVSEPLTYEDDARVLEWGIGLTNMVDRASPSITDLSLDELRAGAAVLRAKLLRYGPRVVCFNGKRIYEVFAGHAVRARAAAGAHRRRAGLRHAVDERPRGRVPARRQAALLPRAARLVARRRPRPGGRVDERRPAQRPTSPSSRRASTS